MSLILKEVEDFPGLSSKASTYLLSFEHISDFEVLAGTHMHNDYGKELGKEKLAGPCNGGRMACQRTTGCISVQGCSLCIHGRRVVAQK